MSTATMKRTQVREKPLRLDGRAAWDVLTGRTTQVRLPLAWQPRLRDEAAGEWSIYVGNSTYATNRRYMEVRNRDSKELIRASEHLVPLPEWVAELCPLGRVDDTLWLREAVRFNDEHDNAYYAADNKGVGENIYRRLSAIRKHRRVITSVHLPRWASRADFTITAVRGQQVQDATEGDARAEGFESVDGLRADWDRDRGRGGPNRWGLNPWSHVVTFERRTA